MFPAPPDLVFGSVTSPPAALPTNEASNPPELEIVAGGLERPPHPHLKVAVVVAAPLPDPQLEVVAAAARGEGLPHAQLEVGVGHAAPLPHAQLEIVVGPPQELHPVAASTVAQSVLRSCSHLATTQRQLLIPLEYYYTVGLRAVPHF